MGDEATTGTWRMSLLVASTEEGIETFDSLDDMPAVMRAQCVRALNDNRAATILIADAAGRDHIEQILRQRRDSQPEPAPLPARSYHRRKLLEVALCAAAGAALWVLTSLR